VSYVLALALQCIPRKSFIGRWLNPHPFNSKEHAAILIMSTTAAHSARAIEVLAVQKLWYDKLPSPAVCIFLIFSSQTLGYGVSGVMRKILVYPTKVSPSFSWDGICLRIPVCVPSSAPNHVSPGNAS
jgi:hypothetical protein